MKLREELRSIKRRDPAARNGLEIVLLYSGFHALLWYRVSHRLYKWKLRGLARFVSQMGRFFTQIEIHPGAQIGRGLFIDHGSGVVIGETAVIGNDVTIYQGVTLGGTGKTGGKRHPTIEDDVVIGAGALVLGGFTVGRGAKIAAGAVVLNEIPPYSTAVGVPAKVVKIGGERVTDIDDRLIPDPVRQELCRLQREIELLKSKVDGMGEGR